MERAKAGRRKAVRAIRRVRVNRAIGLIRLKFRIIYSVIVNMTIVV